MLRPRSDNNTRAINSRKRGENDEPGVGYIAGKQQENIPHSNDPHTGLLKDKNVNQRSAQPHVSPKSGEKDRNALKSPSQRSKFKVFSDKENDIAESPRKKPVIPVKRPGSNLETLSPLAKRTDSRSPVERGHAKEEELPYMPDIDLDLSGFDDRMDIGVYERAHTKPKTELEPIDECESLLEVTDSPTHVSEPVAAPSIEISEDTTEYGPPQEKELSYEPAVNVDLTGFSELPDIAAYEYAETDWEAPTHDDDEVLHYNESQTESKWIMVPYMCVTNVL
ncbi:hypothetical protein BJV82DRAFT_591692 [Fennellomyces sp. T-0311]|nr:hypothetical protein BJV82DRAFT_591692 [Fennellomyces sp. T-0311]